MGGSASAGAAHGAGDRPAGTHRSWNDRVFDLLPVAPWAAGGLAAAALLALFLAWGWSSGELARAAAEGPLWAVRDARILVVFALMAAWLPTARHYVVQGARHDFDALRPLLALDAASAGAARADLEQLDPRLRRASALLALGLQPIGALLIDRDPTLYARLDYWSAVHVFHWSMALWVLWHLGSFAYEGIASARRFSGLAGRLRQIDLLDLSPLAPFARQGLRAVLLWMIAVAIFAGNAVDRGFALLVVGIGIATLAGSLTALLLPVRGVHRRIRAAKRAELARVHAALRGDANALSGTAIAGRGDAASVADLLAYREFVSGVREWPFDASTLMRFALFVALPLGSWLGGALVERLLAVALD